MYGTIMLVSEFQSDFHESRMPSATLRGACSSFVSSHLSATIYTTFLH